MKSRAIRNILNRYIETSLKVEELLFFPVGNLLIDRLTAETKLSHIFRLRQYSGGEAFFRE